MRYTIVFDSPTGNTAALAQAIREALPEEACRYFGAPAPEGTEAEVVFAGFWTDKGTCDGKMARFLAELEGKQVFLFGTAGFGGQPEYFARILEAAAANLPAGSTLIGSYMCQGKMPPAVRERYCRMQEQEPDSPRIAMMLENFDAALTHPDKEDLRAGQEAARAAWSAVSP